MLPFQCYPFCHSPPSLFLLLLLPLLTSIAVSQQPCQPGSFLARNGSCLPCPPGTYQPQSAQTACVPCQGSEIAPEEGSAECTPCGVNELPMEHNTLCLCREGSGRTEDDEQCEICPPGTFSEIGQFQFQEEFVCYECRTGTFQPNPGQLQCQACPPGSFSNRGSPECRSCPPGQVLVGSDCGTCPPGQRYDISELSCLPCDPGTFKATKGPSQCLPCPLGSFSATGATECTTCPPGQTLFRHQGTEACRTCPPGTFFNRFRLECEQCAPGTFQPNENIHIFCFSCAGNSFSLDGATECTTCDRDEVFLQDGNCGRCAVNSSYNSFEKRCERCFFNSFSAGGIVERCTSCPLGTILSGPDSCESCPVGQAAMESGGCGICPAGTYYTGRDCGRCFPFEFQPFPNIDTRCGVCRDGTTANDARTDCIPT